MFKQKKIWCLREENVWWKIWLTYKCVICCIIMLELLYLFNHRKRKRRKNKTHKNQLRPGLKYFTMFLMWSYVSNEVFNYFCLSKVDILDYLRVRIHLDFTRQINLVKSTWPKKRQQIDQHQEKNVLYLRIMFYAPIRWFVACYKQLHWTCASPP